MTNPDNYNFKDGYIVYPDAQSEAKGKKAAYIDHGTDVIPPERYYTKEEADLEWEHMWTKVWSIAGVTQDLQTPGDYFTFDLGPESFIVTRVDKNTIKAYYNVCPHRGNRMIYDEYGHIDEGKSFYCIFHGWRFNVDGSLKEIKDRHLFREESICHIKGLKEVSCDVWNALVFINMDEDPMPLEEYLDVIPEHLKHYDFSRTRVYNEMRGEVASNWKVGIDAFIEFYHADDTHPQALPISATLKTQYDLYKNGMSRMIIPQGYAGDRAQNPDEVTDTLKGYVDFFGGDSGGKYDSLSGQQYRVAMTDAMKRWGKRNGYADMFANLTDDQLADDWNYQAFPNTTLNVFSWGVLVQSWTPHPKDPEKHFYRALSLLLPVKDPEQHVMDPASYAVSGEKGWQGEQRPAVAYPKTDEEWGTILSQDMYRVPKVQEGIRSRAYEGHILCDSENRLRHTLAEIDRYIGKNRRKP